VHKLERVLKQHGRCKGKMKEIYQKLVKKYKIKSEDTRELPEDDELDEQGKEMPRQSEKEGKQKEKQFGARKSGFVNNFNDIPLLSVIPESPINMSGFSDTHHATKMRDPSYVQALKGKGLNEEHQRKLYEMDLELLQIQSAMQRYRTYFFLNPCFKKWNCILFFQKLKTKE